MKRLFILTTLLLTQLTQAQESSTVTDIDGNTYQTITIGKQTWMLENLKVTRFQNGDLIPNIKDSVTWSKMESPAYCNYNNDSTLVEKYGRIYNGFTANDPRNIAPKGWRVPSAEDFEELVLELKKQPFIEFPAPLTGDRFYPYTFNHMNQKGIWWGTLSMHLVSDFNGVYVMGYDGTLHYKHGFPIICVKN